LRLRRTHARFQPWPSVSPRRDERAAGALAGSGHPNILKHLLVHVAGLNLGLLLRQVIGIGTRDLQGRAVAGIWALIGLLVWASGVVIWNGS